jgi:hypothetical protein
MRALHDEAKAHAQHEAADQAADDARREAEDEDLFARNHAPRLRPGAAI